MEMERKEKKARNFERISRRTVDEGLELEREDREKT
jgi:hypothetical protein